MSLSSIFLCPFGTPYNSLSVIKSIKPSISGWTGQEWKKVETSMLEYHISINVVQYCISLLDIHPATSLPCVFIFLFSSVEYIELLLIFLSLVNWCFSVFSLLNFHWLLILSSCLFISYPYQPQITSWFDQYKWFHSIAYKFVSRLEPYITTIERFLFCLLTVFGPICPTDI